VDGGAGIGGGSAAEGGCDPGDGVAVSARGAAGLAGLRWRDFAMLSPLGWPEARRLFLAVAGAGSPLIPVWTAGGRS
jgi:hypothetical protein